MVGHERGGGGGQVPRGDTSFSQLSVRIQLFPPFFKGRQMWVGGNKTNYREVMDIRPPSLVALSSHKSSRDVGEVCGNENTNGV